MRIKLIVQAMKMLTVPVLLAGLTLGPAATALADTAPGGTGATTPTADKTPTPKPKMDVVAADKPTPTPKPKMDVVAADKPTPTPKPKMDVVAADKPTPTPKPKMNVN